MKLTLDQTRATISLLDDNIRHLEAQLDALDPASPAAETKDRQLQVLCDLLFALRDDAERMEEAETRAGAEARWHYHNETDTLYLY